MNRPFFIKALSATIPVLGFIGKSGAQADAEPPLLMSRIDGVHEHATAEDMLAAIWDAADITGSSAVYFTRHGGRGIVRFDIDGWITDIMHVTSERYDVLVDRILNHKHISYFVVATPGVSAEHAQERPGRDARLKVSIWDGQLNLRIATVPGPSGTDLVARIMRRDLLVA